MNLLYQVFGEGKDLSWSQMSARAFVIYFIALLFLRISGRRTFGKKTAFDNTIAIILGAILSRAVVGASGFVPTITCSLVLVLVHRALAWLSIRSKAIRQLLEGASIPLYKDGKLQVDNLSKSLICEEEIMGDVRLNGNLGAIEDTKEIYMETNGEISVVKKKQS